MMKERGIEINKFAKIYITGSNDGYVYMSNGITTSRSIFVSSREDKTQSCKMVLLDQISKAIRKGLPSNNKLGQDKNPQQTL